MSYPAIRLCCVSIRVVTSVFLVLSRFRVVCMHEVSLWCNQLTAKWILALLEFVVILLLFLQVWLRFITFSFCQSTLWRSILKVTISYWIPILISNFQNSQTSAIINRRVVYLMYWCLHLWTVYLPRLQLNCRDGLGCTPFVLVSSPLNCVSTATATELSRWFGLYTSCTGVFTFELCIYHDCSCTVELFFLP